MSNHSYSVVVTVKLTPSQLLAEAILDRPLVEYVEEKRTARPRWSWKLISETLAEDTAGKVDVTAETLRRWYGETVAA